MIAIPLLITFIIAIFRFVLPRKESRLKSEALALENRIKEFQKIQQIEFAQKSNQLQKELIEAEKKLREYSTIISLLNFLTILSAGITILMYVFASKS